MQPQDNNFPIDDVNGANNNAGQSGQLDVNQTIGGATFQPEPQGVTPDANGVGTAWQQETASDVADLYAQPDANIQQPADTGAGQSAQLQDFGQSSEAIQPASPNAGDTGYSAPLQDAGASSMSGVGQNESPASPTAIDQTVQQPEPGNQPTFAPAPDFSNVASSQPQADYSQTPVAEPISTEPAPNISGQYSQDQTIPIQPEMPQAQYPDASLQQPQPDLTAIPEAPQAIPTPQEPFVPDSQPVMLQAEYTPPAQQDVYSDVGTLPGSDQLAGVAGTMDNTAAPQGYYPDGGGMGMPPTEPMHNNQSFFAANKKLIFIIGGAIIGLIIIIISIILVSQSSSNNASTPAPAPAPQPAPKPDPEPASEAAPAPPGYVTIEKQCYSFAIIDPNTVPTDPACSFEDATFGNEDIRLQTLSVITGIEGYTSLEEYANKVKQNFTIESESDIKLDKQDAKQLIYKDVDGKTYSKVLSLVVGRSYQQEGKNVTNLEITTTYQDNYSKNVTANIIDTWRWK